MLLLLTFMFSLDPPSGKGVVANPNLPFLALRLAQGLHLAEVVGGDGKGEEALPGLNYTRQQAFYINIAQVCTMQYNSSTMFQGCFSLSSPPIYISQCFRATVGGWLA